jgi:DNA-binding PucR family transcriptional regulator
LLHVERAPEAAADDGGPEEAAWPELAGRVQARLRRLYRRAFFDARHDSLRALVPLAALDAGAVEQLRLACEQLGEELGVDIGLSDVERGAASARRRMREAADAARIARSLAASGGAVSYERLGAYRYLVNLELDEAPRDRYGQAVAALIEYDRGRKARLVDTLERYLASRCSVAASARALYIHPNTVRQRLERIQQITKLDLREEDLLSLELALKVARLRRVREETGT